MDRRWDSAIVRLPGGFVDGQGTTHRDAEIVPLTGREEEWLAGEAGQDFAPRVTALLSRCVRRIGPLAPVTEAVARRLLVADRQFLMLKLRELTLGGRIRAHLACPGPGCGKKLTVSFSVEDIPVFESKAQGLVHTLALSPQAAFQAEDGGHCGEIAFRLPNGGDEEAVSPIAARDEGRASALMLERCIERIGPFHRPPAEWVDKLPVLARMELEREMEALAPRLDLTFESECPECGQDYAMPFDPVRFLFDELRLSHASLRREVHYLAYHYHWSEQEIMGMARPRRLTYIEVLAGEIERMNNAE